MFISGDKETEFWSKVTKRGKIPPHNKRLGRCWIWTGYLTDLGGRFSGLISHRIAWELSSGESPGVKCIRRICDNPACVRASHMVMVDRGRWGKYPKRFSGKLWPSQVISMRRQYASGRATQSELASMMGVSRSTVGSIVRHDTWKSVTPS